MAGYIYVFTNKSYNEEWIKVGYSEDVEATRAAKSREGVPYEFETYCTYELKDKLVFTDEWVIRLFKMMDPSIQTSPTKQLIKISPKRAEDMLTAVALMTRTVGQLVKNGDIVGKDSHGTKGEKTGSGVYVPVQKNKVKDIVCSDDYKLFYIDKKNSTFVATMKTNGTDFIVLEGSRYNINEHSSFTKAEHKYKDELKRKGYLENGVFLKDCKFSSASAAAVMVLGNSRNGRAEWKDANGRTYGEVFEKKN